jgi:hypothetical protein
MAEGNFPRLVMSCHLKRREEGKRHDEQVIQQFLLLKEIKGRVKRRRK